MAQNINIGGRLHSTATGNIVTGANEVYDDSLAKNQSVINTEAYQYVEDIQNALQNLSPDQQEAIALSGKVNDLDKGLGVVNVNKLNNKATAYNDATTARADVPVDYKKIGLQITYLLSDGWYIDQYIGPDESASTPTPWPNWGTSSNWQVLGPVTVSQNTLMIGDEEKGELAGQLIENPEWVKVVTDSEDKILYGVKTDGKFYFGDGCPPQVQEYVEQKIADLSLDEYEDIVTFLSDYLGSDTTLKVMIDGINASLEEKVDKVEGKSLINADYAETKNAIENPEFLEVTTDSEDKVLEGIQADGTKVIGGDLKVLGNMEVSGVSYKIVENSEYLAAWLDAENKVIFGLKTDGKTYVGDADFLNNIKNNQEAIAEIKTTLATKVDSLDIDALSSITVIENPEFIEAKTDSEGKLVAGRTPDGAAFENVGFSTPKVSIDGHTIENIEDPEGRTEIKTDAEGKILSYRDNEGELHEMVKFNTPKIETDVIKSTTYDFSEKNISELMLLLNERNFTARYDLRLPQVRVTSDLLTVVGNDIAGLTTLKNEVDCTYSFISPELNFVEDGTIAYQGNSTLSDAKKGFSMVLSNKHRFKDWIEMDEFRLKGYGQDWTSGKDVVANRLYGQILATRSCDTNKPWKKYNDFNSTDISLLMDADKKCHMDGFPVELYINNSYWGVYVLEIRKERGNYNLNKNNAHHIQIEGKIMFADSRFTWDTVEIRNPKGYDEYVEPADGTVKTFITNWFNGISAITTNTSQQELEEYLDCQNFIDWYLHNALICNTDVICNNTEFTTWDNKHITLIPQDLNGSFSTLAPYNYDELAFKANDHCSWLQTAIEILNIPIKERYEELRNKGIISIENLTNLWEGWCREIGTDAYKADQDRWNRERTPITSILEHCVGRIAYLDLKFNYSV